MREGSGAQLVVVETVVRRAADGRADVAESRYARPLASADEPVRRAVLVGEGWQALEAFWLEGRPLAVLCLANEPEPRRAAPTGEERAADAARVVEVSLRGDGTADLLIPPGESARLRPACVSTLRARCRSGSARLAAFLVPE